MDDVVRRVEVLEKDMGEIRSLLKDLKDGQHAAALEAAKQTGVLNTSFAEVDTKFADTNGKLAGINEVGAGLRRDLEKLPSKFDVAVIMMSVIGGLVGIATLIKFALPLIAKAFG